MTDLAVWKFLSWRSWSATLMNFSSIFERLRAFLSSAFRMVYATHLDTSADLDIIAYIFSLVSRRSGLNPNNVNQLTFKWIAFLGLGSSHALLRNSGGVIDENNLNSKRVSWRAISSSSTSLSDNEWEKIFLGTFGSGGLNPAVIVFSSSAFGFYKMSKWLEIDTWLNIGATFLRLLVIEFLSCFTRLKLLSLLSGPSIKAFKLFNNFSAAILILHS